MAEQKKTMRQLTQEKFQEEVARELGIDLTATPKKPADIRGLEQDTTPEPTDTGE
ncbi:hypothetical protein Sulac_0702 [Sulfobacillus acidophilus DSM 10332]|uniref:Uncharacterized protein n=1 Tax=Sulfobacillus acidophilus (strain ATCC 700253 / DSM 10332 / NAL) TaxID=679936 RepID=G8U0I7_SULAD|nr:hypothetical protein Sulac_0702 [Sulfobacillus acidophilus DSM 10332]